MQVTECRDSTAASTTANAHIAYTCNRILIGWGVGDYDSATDAQHPHRGRKQTFEFGGRAIQDWLLEQTNELDLGVRYVHATRVGFAYLLTF